MKPVMYFRNVIEVVRVIRAGENTLFVVLEWTGNSNTASVSPMSFLGWDLNDLHNRSYQRILLRLCSMCFLPQSGAVECRRMSCPPLNCSPDSLPVHIAGQCCKVCRRKYWLRARLAVCVLRFIYFPCFSRLNSLTLMKWNIGSWCNIKYMVRRATVF